MTQNRPKLIFLWNYVEWGGAQIFLLAIMKRAHAAFDIIVILPRRSTPTILNFLDELEIKYEFLDVALEIAEARTAAAKVRRQWKRIHAEWTSFRYLLQFDLKSSILHLETAPWQSWLLIMALSARGANVFVTMHNFMPQASALRESLWKTRLQFVSRLPGFHIIASNHDTRSKLKGWLADRFWEKLPVAHTAVDPDQIDAALAATMDIPAVRASLGIDPDSIVVLCVGQFIDRKGRWVFMEAAEKVGSEYSDVRFVWLTPTMPTADEQARVDGYGLGSRLKVIRSDSVGTSREDVLKFFRIADIFTLPSYVEGLPIALLEAMALGLPSVSTNVYAIPEAIKHLQTGVLIEPGDPDALADAISKLVTDPVLRVQLSGSGREFVMANFDERKVADKVISEYWSSLDQR